jgi:hypothetical protein
MSRFHGYHDVNSLSISITEGKISKLIIREIAVYGDADMTSVDQFDDEKVSEIANSFGPDLKNSKKMEENRTPIIELDLWDVSEILFF